MLGSLDAIKIRKRLGPQLENLRSGDPAAQQIYEAYLKSNGMKNQFKSLNEFQSFIDSLFAQEKQWKRYSEILTNNTKFDSNALKNKYIRKDDAGQPSKQSPSPSNLQLLKNKTYIKSSRGVARAKQALVIQAGRSSKRASPSGALPQPYQTPRPQTLGKQPSSALAKKPKELPPFPTKTVIDPKHKQKPGLPQSKSSLV